MLVCQAWFLLLQCPGWGIWGGGRGVLLLSVLNCARNWSCKWHGAQEHSLKGFEAAWGSTTQHGDFSTLCVLQGKSSTSPACMRAGARVCRRGGGPLQSSWSSAPSVQHVPYTRLFVRMVFAAGLSTSSQTPGRRGPLNLAHCVQVPASLLLLQLEGTGPPLKVPLPILQGVDGLTTPGMAAENRGRGVRVLGAPPPLCVLVRIWLGTQLLLRTNVSLSCTFITSMADWQVVLRGSDMKGWLR
jgi:hypothetical protein